MLLLLWADSCCLGKDDGWCDFVLLQSGVAASVAGKKQQKADATEVAAAAASVHDGVMEECEGQLVKLGAAAGFSSGRNDDYD